MPGASGVLAHLIFTMASQGTLDTTTLFPGEGADPQGGYVTGLVSYVQRVR